MDADGVLKYLQRTDGVHALTLWNTRDVDLVKASAAISQWILNTLYLQDR